ncbi:hypothetical protein DSO57_1013677 [Entomophthora muscae]|uniref:Uncharacterized protein n=1 Tax=Entomophthora muscae TaxID=34485 RepID=A0ACC2SUE5_9FUNG|nr:hypothetical protein DSO57_1013677 [Entomophthora muscae]
MPGLLPRPSPGCKLTPAPMKQTDREDVPSPSVFLPHIYGEAEEEEDKPTNPDPPHMYARDSKWNPYHPNRFVSLEDEDVLEIEDHCL